MKYYENICNCLRVIQQDKNRKLNSDNCWQRTSLKYCLKALLFIRLKLDKESTIKIAATDPDDDWIKCRKSEYVEIGIFGQPGHILPGATVDEVNAT